MFSTFSRMSSQGGMDRNSEEYKKRFQGMGSSGPHTARLSNQQEVCLSEFFDGGTHKDNEINRE